MLSDGPQSAIAVGGRLVVSMTLRPPTVESVIRFRTLLLARAREVEDSICVVIIPGARRPALDHDVRREIRETWQALASVVTGAAIWIRRGSFVGALQRSLVTAMMLAIRRASPTQVVASASEATAWFASLDAALGAQTARWTALLDEFVADRDRAPTPESP